MAGRLEEGVGRTVGVLAGAVAWGQGQHGAPLSSPGSSPAKTTAVHGPTCRIIHVSGACSAGSSVFFVPVQQDCSFNSLFLQLQLCCVHSSSSMTGIDMLHSFRRSALASAYRLL